MASHEVTFPITDPDQILALHAGDEVTVQGHIIGIRDRTQIRIFDQGVEPPMDLRGAFLLHTAPNVRKLGPGRYEKVCIGTTTSARMVRFTEPLGERYGVRAICGKGGFPDEAIEPMQRLGMVYFAIVGGAAALETTQIEELEEVAWEELMPECLWRFRVRDFGPLTVGIDAHGNSLYHDVQTAATERLEEILARFDLDLPAGHGLTHVLDKGLGPRGWEDVLETSGDYIDIVKLGWGTAYVTPNLRRKLDVLAGKPVVFGGTFFEVCYLKQRLDAYKSWLSELGLTHVEISDGTVEIPRERKLELIAEFSRDFTVLSEVGAKDSDVVFRPEEWVTWIGEELAAGAWKVVTEGREGGTAGVFRPSGEMRTGLVNEIAAHVETDRLVFEAPTKASQTWFIKRFGSAVNLGNIPVDEVIPLETLRRGLRSDTLDLLVSDDALLAGEQA